MTFHGPRRTCEDEEHEQEQREGGDSDPEDDYADPYYDYQHDDPYWGCDEF